MFTGIVEEIGQIRDIRGSASIKISIECQKILDDIKIGDSIAVNGTCLTVSCLGASWFGADVMPETICKTGLSYLKRADWVNLERAVKLSDRLGGHMVTGHIDGTGMITGRSIEDNAIWLTIETTDFLLKYMVVKGSIAIDGISLTIADIRHQYFKVSLIPLTSTITTLGLKKIGDIVNIECDIIGKYVEKFLMRNPSQSNISRDFLRAHGYL